MAQTAPRRKKKTTRQKPAAEAKDTRKSRAQPGKVAPEDKTGTASNDKTSKNKKSKTTSKSKPSSDGFAAEAMRIVEQAASILEEEISAGIVAAKKVEQRYINVNALRGGSSEQVLQRFRTDAHEVLDILLDLVNLSINALSGLSERAINLRSGSTGKDKSGAKAEEALTEIVLPDVLKAGDSGKVGMVVANESDAPTGKFDILTAGLLSTNGDRLAPECIAFEPPSLEIAANDLEKVTVNVTIPAGTPAGQYSGVLHAPAIQMRALLTVNVTA